MLVIFLQKRLIFHEALVVPKMIIHNKFNIDSHLTMVLEDVYPEERIMGLEEGSKRCP